MLRPLRVVRARQGRAPREDRGQPRPVQRGHAVRALLRHPAGAVQPAARALPAEARGREGSGQWKRITWKRPTRKRATASPRSARSTVGTPSRTSTARAATCCSSRPSTSCGLSWALRPRSAWATCAGWVRTSPASVCTATRRSTPAGTATTPTASSSGAARSAAAATTTGSPSSARRSAARRSSASTPASPARLPKPTSGCHPPRLRHGAGAGLHQRDRPL